MKLSIIVLSFNTRQMTADCLKSITDSLSSKSKSQYEVIVVDNHSSDNSAAYLKKRFPQFRVIENRHNLGFAGGNNIGIRRSGGDFVLLLNSDTSVRPGAIEKLLWLMENSDFAILSCKLRNQAGTFQPNAGDSPRLGPIFFWLSNLDDLFNRLHIIVPTFHQRTSQYYRDGRQVGWVSGSVMMIRRSLFKKVGLLDDKLFMYAEDVEFCFRAERVGYKIGWTDQGEVMHLGGGSLSNPSFNQWRGELSGLLYIYKKYFIWPKRLLLGSLIYGFTVARVLAYLFRGKLGYSLTYLKVLLAIKAGRKGATFQL